MEKDKIRKAAILNLGCKVNKYEADAMKDKLLMAGYEVVEPQEKADIYIVNTCSVTNMAQKKSRQMLRRAKKMNPEAVVVAAGCYVNAEHDALLNELFVDILVGNNCKKYIVTVIEDFLKKRSADSRYLDINRTQEFEEMGSLRAFHMDHTRAYIKIQDGCNQFCSYCIIPYTRGRVRSRRPEYILEEIRGLAKQGVKEFVLTGIHISSYGTDWKDGNMQYDDVTSGQENGQMVLPKRQGVTGLSDLIREITAIPEVVRIRLGSLEPRIVTEEFLTELEKNDKFCPHFHLSLQSACNATLKRMNRKYTIEEFMEICGRIRAHFERPAITTDVIVGFPGETEEEFGMTLANLRELALYEIHVFKYSVRTGTVAAKLPNQVSEEVKGMRSDILLRLTAQQKEAYERSMKGYVDEALFEEVSANEEMLAQCAEVTRPEEVDTGDVLSSLLHREETYYIGHTRRYVKVKLLAEDSMINRVVKVKFM